MGDRRTDLLTRSSRHVGLVLGEDQIALGGLSTGRFGRAAVNNWKEGGSQTCGTTAACLPVTAPLRLAVPAVPRASPSRRSIPFPLGRAESLHHRLISHFPLIPMGNMKRLHETIEKAKRLTRSQPLDNEWLG